MMGEGPYRVVSFTLPFCLYLRDSSLTVVLDGRPAYITLARQVTDCIRGVADQFRVSPLSRLTHDRWGRQALTRVSIAFPPGSLPEGYTPGSPASQNALLMEAVRYSNRLISAYRHVAQEWLIDELTPADIVEFRLYYQQTREEEVSPHAVILFPFSSLETGETHVFHNEKVHNALARLLQQDREIPLHFQLIGYGNASLLRGSNGLGILHFCQAFEVMVKYDIGRGYRKKMRPEAWVMKLLENTPFRSLLENHLPSSTGKRLSSDCLTAWDGKVRPLRNRLAHGEIASVQQDTTEEAVLVLKKCMTELGYADDLGVKAGL